MAKHHLNNLAHKELKMQHLENCSRSITKPHVVHVSSCRWILPSMSECCLWWFERNSICWKINTSFYQSDHITLLNSNFAHIFKGTSFGMTDFIWRANVCYIWCQISELLAIQNDQSITHLWGKYLLQFCHQQHYQTLSRKWLVASSAPSHYLDWC